MLVPPPPPAAGYSRKYGNYFDIIETRLCHDFIKKSEVFTAVKILMLVFWVEFNVDF
jgi:hypothetical protein